MKITPMASSANMVGAVSAANSAAPPAPQMMKLRMTTNATPGRYEPQADNPALSTGDPNEVAEPGSEVTQPLSPQFAALAKQKRALQVKEREIADREKALAERSGTQPGMIDAARLKADPLRVLEEAGVSYEALTEAVMSDMGKPDRYVRELEAKIKTLEEGIDKKLTDRDTQAEQQVLAEMRREATALIAEGDAFEMVRETGSVPHVMKLIERTYRETGEVLDVREALRLVEDELVDESLKVARLQKVQSRLAPPAPVQPPPRQSGMRTLTNRDTAQIPMSAKQRAMAAFHGNLKR
jgi:hypothetical protein